jgi:hypothetical protein
MGHFPLSINNASHIHLDHQRPNWKLAHNPVFEGLAFLFEFQIGSFPIAAGALGSPAGRLLDVQPSASANETLPQFLLISMFTSAHVGLVPEFF